MVLSASSTATDLPKGNIFIFPYFFTGSGSSRIPVLVSQRIAILHEAVHLTGRGDIAFGTSPEQGSKNLSNIIIHSCYSEFYSVSDLAFAID
jgi:hypothetical protein